LKSVRFKVLNYPAGAKLQPHNHKEGQIIFARSGAMDVWANQKMLAVPSSRAAWVPAYMDHAIQFRSHTKMRTAFIDPKFVGADFDKLQIFHVTQLFRELLLRLVENEENEKGYHSLLVQALIREFGLLKNDLFSLKFPTDKRAKRVADRLFQDPANNKKIDAWAKIATCSSKTLSRLFLSETGLTFRLWRRHLRLLLARHHLEEGMTVTKTAYEVGFSTSSSFAEAHKLTFGFPPTQQN